MNARQRRLFEEARKKNPDLKMPSENASDVEPSEEDLARIKQGVGDKTSRSSSSAADSGGGESRREQGGSIVTYFEAKGFGFLRPDDGGRDVFFHVSRLADGGDATTLKPGTRVLYELGMDRTGKLAASSVRLAPPEPPAA